MKQSAHGRWTAKLSLLWTIPGDSMVPPGIVYGPYRTVFEYSAASALGGPSNPSTTTTLTTMERDLDIAGPLSGAGPAAFDRRCLCWRPRWRPRTRCSPARDGDKRRG